MSDSEFQRISSLFEASLAGKLTTEQREDLETALESSEELRIAYLQAMSMHLDLDQLSRSDEDLPKPIRATPKSEALERKPDNPRSGVRYLIALAASVAILLSAAALSSLNSQSEPIAASPAALDADQLPVIAEVAGASIFGQGGDPKPGQKLVIGQKYVLTQGYLALQFHSGARAVIKAPSVFSAQGIESLLVRSGECSVYAPPGAEGFELLSPSAEIIDLGTRFVVNVAETGETQLTVVEGEATMSALKSEATAAMHLLGGDAAQVDPGMPPRRLQAALNSRLYRDRLPDRVVRYDTTFVDSYADELLSLTIQRNGITQNVVQEELIPARVVHFESNKDVATFCTRMGDELPAGEDRLSLLSGDFSLVTGIINPMASPPHDVAMRLEFAEPIINGPGPEIVIFDLQLLVYDPAGDKLVLRSGDQRTDRPQLTVEQFDIGLNSPFALDLMPHCTYRSLEKTYSVEDLVQKQFMHGRQVNVDARALAVAVDLSDLGYDEGESLRQLEFLSDSGGIDPVLVVGLRP